MLVGLPGGSVAKLFYLKADNVAWGKDDDIWLNSKILFLKQKFNVLHTNLQ